MVKLSKSIDKWTGIRNGMLIAIKNLGYRRTEAGRPYSVWLFKCDCGNEKELCPSDVFKIRPNKPKVKGTMSCGCQTKRFQSDNKLRPDGEAALTGLYATYRLSCAQQRGYDFELNIEQFRELTGSNCFYCGKEPSQIKKSKISFYKYNGIDRVDNTKGYLLSNVVPSCKECNSLKSGITIEIAKKMLKFLGLYND